MTASAHSYSSFPSLFSSHIPIPIPLPIPLAITIVITLPYPYSVLLFPFSLLLLLLLLLLTPYTCSLLVRCSDPGLRREQGRCARNRQGRAQECAGEERKAGRRVGE